MDGARLLVFCSLLALIGLVSAGAQQKVGEATYLEGGVSLERNGQELDSSEVQTGLAIQNFDLVKTEADGLAEVHVDNPLAPSVTIKVSPLTQFSFELSKLGARQQTSVGLLGGTIALKVSKLSSSQNLGVMLDTAVCGVRGTEFSITTVPSGDMLVTCSEGDVALTDEAGKETQAVPGTAVERRAGEAFRTLAVTGTDLEAFRTTWEKDRIAYLKEHALDVIQRDAARYNALTDEYDEEYAALQDKKDMLASWESDEKNGKIANDVDVEKENGEVGELMADLRETQFLLERAYYRLAALKDYHDQGFGRGDIRPGLSTTQFFGQFQRDRKDLELRMAGTRKMIRLFVVRNKGRDPTLIADLRKFFERRLVHLKKLKAKKKLTPAKT